MPFLCKYGGGFLAVAVSSFVLGLLLYALSLPASAFAIGLTRHRHHRKDVLPGAAPSGGCDVFSGGWLYGRQDSDYLRYRWKPAGCELPRFDGADFLTRMKGKTVMFVGDSLGRNQWESLVCVLHAAAPQSPAQLVSVDPLYSYKFLEYGLVVSFYRAPYLVDIDMAQRKKVLVCYGWTTSRRTARRGTARRGADVLSFNSGHWWTHTGALQGWDYMGADGRYYEDMDRMVAFQCGMATWANWVDLNVDPVKTRVFFQSMSPTHYRTLKSGVIGLSQRMTALVAGPNATTTAQAATTGQNQVIQSTLRSLKNPARLLNITALSALRKDAHPSVYSGGLTPAQRANPAGGPVDCSHWCLPGLPDTWNQLFYTLLFFYQ
ncbi:hypothetical protein GUJ93_ZPchr0003g18223 [Zizania palustris]|uniref:Trichome birefringence-like C-terminal domain-containing protein n=1 Tax=Zizania palustris TaxID=103762 RepID=A0A8J5VLK4_ZIZPA|nr:hypothetical protein GUJ93_ZPchr0003g18223 [Zizania palustris]